MSGATDSTKPADPTASGASGRAGHRSAGPWLALAARLARLRAGPSPATLSTIGYVLRTLLAMGLAFYAALWLQLQTPASAAVTVMIVANPSRGGILSKGLWRIFGTLTGAVAAVVILGAFGQAPLLFVVGLAFWLGLCTFASSMFRHFRAYAAVLSGYTVALIAAGALATPDHVLGFALARLAVVTIGVVVSTIVTMVFQPSVTTDGMRARGRGALQGVARLMLARADGLAMDHPAFIAERTRLATEIERLDEAVEFSGAEAPDVSRHAGSIRRGFAAMYAALLSVSIAGNSLTRLAAILAERRETAAMPALQLAAGLDGTPAAQPAAEPATLPEAPAAAPGVDIVAEVRGQLAAIAHYDPQDRRAPLALAEAIAARTRMLSNLASETRTLDETTTLARLYQELDLLHAAIVPFAAWRMGRRPYHHGPRLHTFIDYATAGRNGARSFIAVVLGGLFPYITGWNMGASLLVVLASACALLSGLPSAAAASIAFAQGITLATLLAFLWEFFILPHITGFPILALVLLPVLLPAVWGTTRPRTALLSLGFVIFFITELGFANQMHYDVVTFINNAVAFIMGAWLTVLVFRVILPPNPMRNAAYLTRRIRRMTEHLVRAGGGHRGRRDWLGWLVTYNQAIQRLALRLQVDPALRSRTIGDCGALLIVAQEAVRLRSLLPALNLAAEDAAAAGLALGHLGRLRRPRRAARAADAMGERLIALYEAGGRRRQGLLQAAASFRTIAAMMAQAERLLALEAPLPQEGA
ncbi:FUSC family protein [Acidisoma sp. C75]